MAAVAVKAIHSGMRLSPGGQQHRRYGESFEHLKSIGGTIGAVAHFIEQPHCEFLIDGLVFSNQNQRRLCAVDSMRDVRVPTGGGKFVRGASVVMPPPHHAVRS